MEKLVVIIDVMPEYARRLAVYLNGSRDFPYRAVVLDGAGEAGSYRDREAIYAILAAEQLEREVLEIAAGTSIRIIWLGETKGTGRGTVRCRYDSAKEIKKLFTVREPVEKRVPVIGFYSPAGGAEAEILSRKIALELGKRGKLLYVPFFPFGIYGRENGDGLSEALFYLRQKDKGCVRTPLQGLLQQGERMDSIGPLRWYTDGESITIEDLALLLNPETWDADYRAFMVAVGQFDEVGRRILNCCDRVLVPVWEQEEGKRLQEEFRRQLKESGEVKMYSGLVEFSVTDPLSLTLENAVECAGKKGGAILGEDAGGAS